MKSKTDPKDFYEYMWELPLLLLTGGVSYYGIEVLFRGYSHWSMALCGALCFFSMYQINDRLLSLPLWVRALMCAALITAVELLAGCVFNLWLGWRIWDYSNAPLNLWGQICLPFCVLWFLLSLFATGLCSLIRRHVFLRSK